MHHPIKFGCIWLSQIYKPSLNKYSTENHTKGQQDYIPWSNNRETIIIYTTTIIIINTWQWTAKASSYLAVDLFSWSWSGNHWLLCLKGQVKTDKLSKTSLEWFIFFADFRVLDNDKSSTPTPDLSKTFKNCRNSLNSSLSVWALRRGKKNLSLFQTVPRQHSGCSPLHCATSINGDVKNPHRLTRQKG